MSTAPPHKAEPLTDTGHSINSAEDRTEPRTSRIPSFVCDWRHGRHTLAAVCATLTAFCVTRLLIRTPINKLTSKQQLMRPFHETNKNKLLLNLKLLGTNRVVNEQRTTTQKLFQVIVLCGFWVVRVSALVICVLWLVVPVSVTGFPRPNRSDQCTDHFPVKPSMPKPSVMQSA